MIAHLHHHTPALFTHTSSSHSGRNEQLQVCCAAIVFCHVRARSVHIIIILCWLRRVLAGGALAIGSCTSQHYMPLNAKGLCRSM